jgi:hypothetical protein
VEVYEFELLHELVPQARLIGVLLDPTLDGSDIQVRKVQAAPRTIAQQVLVLNVSTHADIAKTFEPQQVLVLNVSTTHADIAKTFELSAATSLARLWRDQGKRREARDLLVPIYGWFTEDFDASVLKSLQIYELPGTNKETEGLVRVGHGFGNTVASAVWLTGLGGSPIPPGPQKRG